MGSSWEIPLNLSFFPCNMRVTPNVLPTSHMGSQGRSHDAGQMPRERGKCKQL